MIRTGVCGPHVMISKEQDEKIIQIFLKIQTKLLIDLIIEHNCFLVDRIPIMLSYLNDLSLICNLHDNIKCIYLQPTYLDNILQI